SEEEEDEIEIASTLHPACESCFISNVRSLYATSPKRSVQYRQLIEQRTLMTSLSLPF
ncbi:hypothetical protein M407DRAFT_18994, partial [Tulasnella calospora MUT 4182]